MMKVETKTEVVDQDIEVKEDEVPPEGEVVAPAPVVDEEKRKLEIENAELRGKASAFETISKNSISSKEPTQADQWKSTALADINGLNDDDFQTKYKYSKLQVNSAILQNDFQTQTVAQNQKFAKIEAENKIVTKHPDFFEYSKEIQDAIDEVAPEVRQDPERLAKVMERAYLAASKGSTKKENVVERKHITTGFEKPSPKREVSKQNDNDEIPEEFSKTCKAFGLTSEKERKSLMESIYVETNFGNGIVLRDPEKGFEKIGA
jgi:hypothetical protein